MTVADYLDAYTYETILQNALSRVPNTVDKREGSVIYDAIAPACAELAQAYIELKGIYTQTYVLTATGENLDLRVAEEGIYRFQASLAIKKASFANGQDGPKEVPIGNRFSTIGQEQDLNYIVVDVYKDESGDVVPGSYMLQCESPGTVGNNYIGNILPITPVNDVAVAYMDDILVPARDEETDDELRARYQERVEVKSFGGNIAEYDEKVGAVEGVGEVQIYPVWDGSGTVKCSIIGADYNPAPPTLINQVQEAIDPENMMHGLGLGLAPIDHSVTITTATPVSINVAATINLSGGYDIGQVRNQITESIGAYLLSVRKQWGIPDDLNNYFQRVFVSQINFAILSIPGVANVTGTTINGSTNDLYLTEDKTTQELPVLGEVVINAG